MKTVRTNTEVYLGSILQSLSDDRASWSAHVYHLSLLKAFNQDKTLEKILFGILTEQVAEYDGYIFFCDDEDIILLAKNLTKKDTDKISSLFIHQVVAVTGRSVWPPLTAVYDLATQWGTYAELCDRKHRNFLANKQTDGSTKTAKKLVADTHLASDAVKRLLEKGMAERKERKKPCILLVEDDPVSLHLARKALDGRLTVETATSVADARTSYMTLMPDVVFLDIGLPDASGHELLGELVKLDPEAYIVMLRGNSFPTDILRSMRQGAKGFVGKPFSRAKLLQYIGLSPHCQTSITGQI